MPAPTTATELVDLVTRSGVVEGSRLTNYMQELQATGSIPSEPSRLAGLMVRDGILTFFQAEQFLMGKWKRFSIGKYKVLERLGSGGMGQVFLCEHKLMRRRVAVKVLPTAKADDPSSLERFYREARAVAALDHPNIVRAYDIDQDENLHFLVMEYVDGSSLQDLIKKTGPIDPVRACHYIYQSAIGIQHAFDTAGLVHRDIKPGNILVDRSGTVKILDMGLARFFHDEDDLLTKKYDENVLGTADYLAPEQAMDSHSVDVRADIYSLGATFYYMLTGNPPFTEGTVAQKLIWHQTKPPKPIADYRKDVQPEIIAIVQKMMAKDPTNRFQTPTEIALALEPFVRTPIAPPSDDEMPRLSPAATSAPAGTVPVGAGKGMPSMPVLRRSPAPSMAVSPPRRVEPMAAPPGSGSVPHAAESPKADVALPGSADPIRATSPPPATPMPTPADPNPVPYKAPIVDPAASAVVADPEEWEDLGFETPDPNAHADTQPNPSVYEPPSIKRYSSKRLKGEPGATPRSRKPFVILGVLASVLVIGMTIAYLLGLFRRGVVTPKTSTESVLTPQRLVVNRNDSQPGQLKSVAAALTRARKGDQIVIQGPTHAEHLSIEDGSRYPTGITFESADPAKPVVWQLPPEISEAKSLITLAGVNDWHFRSIVFDGMGKVENGIYMTSVCPGVTFEGFTIRGVKSNAIKLNNTVGEKERPVRFRNGRLTTAKPAESGVTLFAYPKIVAHPANRFVSVSDLQIDGPFKSGFVIDGSLTDVEIIGSRVFKTNDGVVMRSPIPGQYFQFTLRSNTFVDLARAGVTFEGGIPAPAANAPESDIRLTRNYFGNTKLTGMINGPLPKLTATGNARSKSTADGNLFKAAEIDQAFSSLDPNEPKAFLRYPKNSPLGKSADGPIGAPPVD
jgi:serine/threonine protein kinase